MKKYLLLLVAVMLATVGRAAVGDTFEYDGLNYTILSEDDHTVEVKMKGYPSGDLIIPAQVANNGVSYTVTAVADEGFETRYYLTSVTLPETVTSIGGSAFSGCDHLTAITIPNSVISIGRSAFNGCSQLKSITIPNGLTSIEDYTFYDCSSLTSITIPKSVTSIGKNAFQFCSGLTSVTIPNSVTTIGKNAFGDCTGLAEINVEEGSQHFSSEEGVLYNYDKTTLLQCQGAKTNCVIPETVTSIGDYAFIGCTDLTSITLPQQLTSIGDYSFGRCSGLTSIDFPNSLISIGKGAFYECAGLTSIIIPNSVTSIGDDAFEYCTSLTSIDFPNSLISIGEYAFYNCEVLTSVIIPNAVTYIGESAFRRCSGLTEVVIGESVTEIGEQAFRHCSNLTKVVNLNPTPQELVYDEFDGIADDAVLYVPSGSVDAYKAAEGWSVFSDIRGMGAFEVALSAETLEIAEGEYAKIDAKIVKDGDVTVESEEWSSSDPAVAVVKDGVVTAVAPGKAVITYTAVDSYGVPHTASCVVTVAEGQNSIGEIGYDADATVDVYTLQGVAVLRNAPAADLRALPAGIYIIRQNKTTRKIAVK